MRFSDFARLFCPFSALLLFYMFVPVKYVHGTLCVFSLCPPLEIWKGESDASDFMPKTVQIFKDKGLTRISEGALVVDVAIEGENVKSGKFDENGEEIIYNKMPPLILQKSNGGDLYATSDIATIYMRNLEAKYDELIYLTDSRQIEHFKKVFRGSKLSGISPKNQVLTHIPFGAMCGEDGKPFKTRSGDTVKLDEIVSMAQEKAKEKLVNILKTLKK